MKVLQTCLEVNGRDLASSYCEISNTFLPNFITVNLVFEWQYLSRFHSQKLPLYLHVKRNSFI